MAIKRVIEKVCTGNNAYDILHKETEAGIVKFGNSNVEVEINNIRNNYQPKSDNALTTANKTIAGSINEVNAKANILSGNYSLQEHDTGRKWTDGKPIYEKTIVGTLNPTSVNQQTGFSFGLTVNTLVAYSVVGTDGNGYYFGDVGEQENGIAFIRTLFARYIVVFNHFLSVGLAAPYTMYTTIQYTK